ncbi:hypothetical protein EWM64_g9455 [Hericium alpestre]|uniref:Beta-glucuronidase C-terminal domain-containing protein n=1 Tax=Hericium alpestre TaxID=135208 RepID=A0A4Y9ZMA8_9AGAM|nr:hypothetical protein EWM64_g9455 [Hericium alpestre]
MFKPFLFVLSVHSLLTEAQTISVSVPALAPSSAPSLPGSLISFSIEQDRWVDWIGQESRNDFFFNVLDNLKSITGEAPHIRIGADSEDHTDFSRTFSEAIFPASNPTTPYPEATNVTSAKGTEVIWGVNFGTDNLTAAFLETQAIVQAFTSPAMKTAGVTLQAMEIGNEADLYGNNGHRNSSFNAQQYTSHISQHHYEGSFCSGSNGLLQDLLSKAHTRGNLSAFAPDIAAAQQRGLQYVLGETNSYSCHGAPGVSNVAGTALWGLDYALFAAQLGVQRVHFHEGVGYKYNFPVTLTRSILDGSTLETPLAPHIQPLYYAAIVAAEAIGKSGATRAVELNTTNDQIAGYAFFEHDTLARAAFINLKSFTEGTRGSVHVDLTGGAAGEMTVRRLSIPTANATSGVSWGGQTYETSDGKVSGSLKTSRVSVRAGVDVNDTEVVLLTF